MQRIEIVILEWCKAMLGQESGVNEPKPETLISIDFFFLKFQMGNQLETQCKSRRD